jgi:hypothetical protein
MIHTPTLTNALYTCPACSFRAVATSAGLFVTVDGDDKAAHLATIVQQRDASRAEAARIMDRLREQYGSHATFGGQPLGLNQLQRLFRAVVAEFAEG